MWHLEYGGFLRGMILVPIISKYPLDICQNKDLRVRQYSYFRHPPKYVQHFRIPSRKQADNHIPSFQEPPPYVRLLILNQDFILRCILHVTAGVRLAGRIAVKTSLRHSTQLLFGLFLSAMFTNIIQNSVQCRHQNISRICYLLI